MEQLKEQLLSTPLLQVLDFLLQNPDVELADSEIVLNVKGAKRAAINAALLKLRDMKIISREYRGRHVLSKLNQDISWILHFKIVSNLLELSSFIEKIKNLSSEIVLFGSRAHGTNRHDSDYDLLIISMEQERIIHIANKLPVSEQLQLLIKTPEEMLSLDEAHPVLSKEIRGGIVLWEK